MGAPLHENQRDGLCKMKGSCPVKRKRGQKGGKGERKLQQWKNHYVNITARIRCQDKWGPYA